MTAPDGPVLAWRERDGRLLRLRLARPKANVIDAAMTAALRAAVEAPLAPGDPLSAMLLDADGPHFSFGASVEEHLPEECTAMLAGFHALIRALLRAPVPVLAVVRGQCLGGGLEVVAAAHRIFAAPDARLGQPEIRLGVIAPAASCLLPRRIGQSAAEDLLLSGRSVGAAEAQAMGLVDVVADDAEAAALAYFDGAFADKSASSVRCALRAARQGEIDTIEAKLAVLERLYLDDLMATRDAVEGLTAFLEKRTAQWEHC